VTLFVHDREPRPEWQAECERIAPRSQTVNWALIHWEPGETWDPVQRWVIREMVPRLDAVNPIQVQAYGGPHPRSIGTWKDGRWHSDSVLSKRQYDLYQQTRCHSRVVWVVQGDQGGHPRYFTHAEEQFARARQLPTEPPPLGSLPYAEPDRRTWARLAELDKLRKWAHRFSADWTTRQETKTAAGLWVLRDGREDYEAWGRTMQQWFDEGIKEALDGVSRADWNMVRDLPPSRDESPSASEALDRQFLTSSALGAEE
jgi:hypothetical protein